MASRLDKISGQFFLLGLATSKLKNFPLKIISLLLGITSLACYLIGYSLWFVASLLYPRFARDKRAWYGFADLKSQYQLSSFLGLAATILCICIPSMLLIASWTFTLSNFVWGVAEYHKLQNPPPFDEKFSSERQSLYLKYTKFIIVASILTAGCLSMAWVYPWMGASLLLFSNIVGNGLTIAAFWFWTKSMLENFEPDKKTLRHSYQAMAESLEADLEQMPSSHSLVLPKGDNYPPLFERTNSSPPNTLESSPESGPDMNPRT